MRSAVFKRVLGVPSGASEGLSSIDMNPVDPVVAARWLALFMRSLAWHVQSSKRTEGVASLYPAR
jgi:hypothetical protein